MTSSPAFRPATAADAERLALAVVEGMRGYRSFAPSGWSPPPLEAEAEHQRRLLADPEVWCLLAEDDSGLVGQVTVLPAARAARPVNEAGLAHLRNLFVRPDCWGSGVAGALHADALAAAGDRGFATLRLFTAAGQRRARRFYEREGWIAAGGPFFDPAPGLEIVEYRRTLRPRVDAGR